jgi:hypothetical protein
MPTNENATVNLNHGGARKTIHSRLPVNCSAPENVLLSRLEHVKNYGEGWRAKCPAHDGKTTSSLAINTSQDGRVLLHCFGGCPALNVMQALGLGLSDLYPQKPTADMTPFEREKRSLGAKQAQWEAARSMLQLESRIVWVAGRQIRDGDALNDDDLSRLELAMDRITDAGVVINGR